MARGLATAAVTIAVVVAILIIASAALPDEYLRVVESLPAKRILLAAFGVLVLVAVVAIYYVIVLPSPPRVTWTVIATVLLPATCFIMVASGKPEECRFELNPSGLPTFVFKFGGFNLTSLIMVGMILWFIRSLVLVYDRQYRELSSPATADGRSSPPDHP